MLFVACSSDDEPAMSGDTPPENLIGTWDMYGTVSVTFRANGTGEIQMPDFDDEEDYQMLAPKVNGFGISRSATARAEQNLMTVSFKWSYNASSRQIKLLLRGETIVWGVISLSEGNLVIRDSEGEEFSMQKSAGNTPDVPDAPGKFEIGAAELLYGTWGAAGKKIYSFTKDGVFIQGDIATGYDKGYFQYDENTHIIHVTWPNGGSGSATVTALSPTIICLTYRRDSGENVNGFLSRIDENDHNTIGSLSLIYDKKLTAMGMGALDDAPMTMTIGSNGKLTQTAFSYNMTFDYEYDENTHLLSLSAYGGQATMQYTVIKLTKDVLILERRYIDDGRLEVMLTEYREI